MYILLYPDMGDSEPDKLDEVATWSPDQLSDITSKILDRVKAHQGGEVVSPNLSRTVHVKYHYWLCFILFILLIAYQLEILLIFNNN